MHKQHVTKRLFRLFAAMIVVIMAFSQAAGAAQAQEGKPPVTRGKVPVRPVNLGEVQGYYERLGGVKGIVGVVIELEDTPAGLIYASSQQIQSASTANIVSTQVNLIKQKQNTVMNALKTNGISTTELFRTQKAYNGIWVRVDAKDLKKLASTPGVKALHPIIPKVLDHTTSVPLIGAPQVWGGLSAALGENIKIGIIDTGIDYVHTNFGGEGLYAGQDFTRLTEIGNLFPTAKVAGGWDFAGDAYDADPSSGHSTPVPDPDPMDCNGHGSHVSGSAAGFGVNPDGSTYEEAGADTYAALKNLTPSAYISKFRIGPGVAPKAELYALRVFGCNGSTDLTEQAIEWAMDPNGDADLSDHLDVINMSLGSNFGSEYDTSAVAANNAALAGVVVVASSGNAGDVYYVTGAPAAARYAISVASSVDASAVFSGFNVTANTATTPLMPAGTYAASEADFGPTTYSQAGALATTTPANGCTAISTSLTGKIALIDRGVCSFKTKVLNAQNAGAAGVLIANSVAGWPIILGDDATITTPITIPAMMVSNVIGASLKTDLGAGTVTVLLSTTLRNSVLLTDPSIVDTVSSFSSRGPARNGTLLKPDITAPGDTIFSTANGTGNQGANFSGTSMASPHMAGVMALLKQIHPTWSVADLKALAMNTATNDLWTSPAQTAVHTPTRVGAGRVSVANAALASVIAYNSADPGQVSLAFGEKAVLGTQNYIKSLTIKNTGAAPVEYLAAFDNYYQANPGLTFVLLDASDVSLDHSVTAPAGGTVEIKVKVTAVAANLTRAGDASISTFNDRERFSEGGGYITLTSTGSDPTLRVPVHIAARPASDMGVVESHVDLPFPRTGTLSLTPSGTPVDTADDSSFVTILELMETSPNDASSSGPVDAADLHYIGATSDYPAYPFDKSTMYFGIATFGKWDTPSAVEFDIYIDVDEDGTEDYVIFNTNFGFFTGTTDDVMLTAIYDLTQGVIAQGYYINGLSGANNTNLFNNNVMVLPVSLTSIGLVDGANTNFDFYVVSFSRDAADAVDISDLMSYDAAQQAFNTVDPVYTGMPIWYDIPAASPTFDISYDKSAFNAGETKGLLLLHHHNTAGSTTEVVTVTNIAYPTLYLPLIMR